MKKMHQDKMYVLCLRVCIAQVKCFGSEFSFFVTNLANVLYTCIFTYVFSMLGTQNNVRVLNVGHPK